MEQDKEVVAMAAVSTALSGLDPDSRARVVRWAAERFQISVAGPAGLHKVKETSPAGSAHPTEASASSGEYAAFSDLYEAANPETEAQRLLVAGYWFQVIRNMNELESHSLNKELNHLGHPIGHMPHTVDDLMNAKPRLMIQLKKQGKSRQARRKFKLTTEGIKKVREMISATATA
ncbi:MAG: hypothetical protein HY079_15005 [Elusimicrobia bacterium]|nr:hypothetical protein [Elusimicrobiota bacterium]